MGTLLLLFFHVVLGFFISQFSWRADHGYVPAYNDQSAQVYTLFKPYFA